MPDVVTKYVIAEILRYLGAKIGLVTTTVLSLCADFEADWATEAIDETDNNNNNNNNSNPTNEHKQSTVDPKIKTAKTT